MPPCERDNNCYHECEEAEADGGNVFQTNAEKKKKGGTVGSEEQHTIAAQIHGKGMLVKNS